jgi:hypothetical protein
VPRRAGDATADDDFSLLAETDTGPLDGGDDEVRD